MEQLQRIGIVREFFQAWETGLSAIRPFLARDVVFWHPWAQMDWSNFDNAHDVLWSNFSTGRISLTVKSIIEQGDRVAVEVKGYAPLKNGTVYDQDYFFLLEFAGDKIKLLKEYSDTQHANQIWGGILKEAGALG